MIIALTGTIGSGKTAAMTMLLHSDWINGRKIYANYHLLFEYNHLNGLGEFTNWPKEPCSIGIDEAHSAGMDSRSSMSPINKFYTRNMTQSRKIESHVYLTAQDFSMIDRRVRQITKLLIGPEILETDADGKPTWLLLNYTTRPFRTGWEDELEIPLFGTGVNICDLYDTSEIIEEMEDPQNDKVQMLADKYKELGLTSKKDGGLTNKQFIAYLKNREGVQESTAEETVNYIKTLAAIESF